MPGCGIALPNKASLTNRTGPQLTHSQHLSCARCSCQNRGGALPDAVSESRPREGQSQHLFSVKHLLRLYCTFPHRVVDSPSFLRDVLFLSGLLHLVVLDILGVHTLGSKGYRDLFLERSRYRLIRLILGSDRHTFSACSCLRTSCL